MSSGRFVPIRDLATAPGLTAHQRIDALATAMEWLAVAQAFKLMHGDRAAGRLDQLGCPVRFDDGRPMIWVP